MSLCGTGSLLTIRSASSTSADCGCECDLSDLIASISYACIGSEAGVNLDTILQNINDAFCVVQEDIVEIEEEITLTGSDWCVPNSTPPPATSTLQEVVDFIAEELIPRSGNNCDDCPITDDLFFTDTKGIYQCTVSQDGGYVIFNGDYTKINADEQTKVESDLWIEAGLSAGFGSTTTDLNLGSVDLGSLKYTYTLDCTAASRTITLPEIGAGLDNSKRTFAIRRIDCVVGNTGTIQAFAGETIETAGSITIPVGHSYIIHANSATEDWKIIGEYYGGCDSLEEQNNGDIYMAYKVGIGDSTPDAKLDIVNATVGDVTLIVENTGVAVADLLQVKINGTTKDVIDEAGSLHLGGSNPSGRLHVTGIGNTSVVQYSILVEDSAGEDRLSIQDGGEIKLRPATNFNMVYSTSGALSFLSDAGSIRTQTIQAERITWGFALHTTANVSVSVGDVYWNMITSSTTAVGGAASTYVLKLAPTIGLSAAATGDFVGIGYTPTVNSIVGRHYAAVFASGDIIIGGQTADDSAKVQIDSTTQGFLPPRMTTTQRDAIASPIAGLQIFNSTTNKINFYNGAAWEVVTSA